MNKAFTLIELLVVVLIVGILAAIALPQYNRAVEKSRFTQGFIMGKALMNAEALFFILNDAYTEKFEELGINIPDAILLENFSLAVCTGTSQCVKTKDYVYRLTGTGLVQVFREGVWVFEGSAPARSMTCIASRADIHEMCKSLGGTQRPDKHNYYNLK